MICCTDRVRQTFVTELLNGKTFIHSKTKTFPVRKRVTILVYCKYISQFDRHRDICRRFSSNLDLEKKITTRDQTENLKTGKANGG